MGDKIMDVKSLQEINQDFLRRRQNKKGSSKLAAEILFWFSAVLILVAILSFNYNSFLTRPVFGYSLYLTEDEKNLLLVKSVDNIDPNLTASLIYQTDLNLAASGICGNNHQTVEIGIVKATYPKLGTMLSFIIDKIYIAIIAAVLWLATILLMKIKQPSSKPLNVKNGG